MTLRSSKNQRGGARSKRCLADEAAKEAAQARAHKKKKTEQRMASQNNDTLGLPPSTQGGRSGPGPVGSPPFQRDDGGGPCENKSNANPRTSQAETSISQNHESHTRGSMNNGLHRVRAEAGRAKKKVLRLARNQHHHHHRKKKSQRAQH